MTGVIATTIATLARTFFILLSCVNITIPATIYYDATRYKIGKVPNWIIPAYSPIYSSNSFLDFFWNFTKNMPAGGWGAFSALFITLSNIYVRYAYSPEIRDPFPGVIELPAFLYVLIRNELLEKAAQYPVTVNSFQRVIVLLILFAFSSYTVIYLMYPVLASHWH